MIRYEPDISVLSEAEILATAKLPTGTEWLEALISTGLRYAVPRLTGGADLWDGAVTVKSLGYALDRHMRMLDAYAEMDDAQRAAVWTDDELAPMRRAVRQR